MDELTRRRKYNQQALKAAEQYRMSQYRGMVIGVETPALLEQGGNLGLIAVTDEADARIPNEFQYAPHVVHYERDGRLMDSVYDKKTNAAATSPKIKKLSDIL